MSQLTNVTQSATSPSKEWVQEKLTALREPFDPEDINWKPQTVDYKKKKAMAVASADIRAYMDRLNDVVGPGGWIQSFSLTVTPYKRVIRAKLDYKDKDSNGDPKVLEPEKVVDGNKVFVVATVYIEGLGSHSSTGEEDASDENAATSAEAQAFKRACVAFGLGRYLYDLPKQELPYDYGKFQAVPQLPPMGARRWSPPFGRWSRATPASVERLHLGSISPGRSWRSCQSFQRGDDHAFPDHF
jgi:hypothetical protein